MAGLSLAWLLADERVGQIVVGPGRPEHLEPVREALAAPLSAPSATSSARCLGLMRVLVLSMATCASTLTPAACLEAMAEVLAALARGEAYMPLRSVMRAPGAAG
jgi:hypothetical protein